MDNIRSGDELSGATFASWQSYRAFAKTVRRRRRYVWPRDVRSFLAAVRRSAKNREFRIERNQPFFRAQVGWEHEVEEQEDGSLRGPSAFGPKRMKPGPEHAIDGRASSAGVPVLYLALEIKTAIAEVRPWVGSKVSVSQFRTTRDLKALDLSAEYGRHWLPPLSFKESRLLPVDPDGMEKAVWTDIDNAFSRPVARGDDQAEYVPTQILAEVFRDEGYEAIAYRSSLVEAGYNVVIFDPTDAEPLDGRPYEIKKICVAAEEVGNAWVKRR